MKFIARPIIGGAVLVERVATGVSEFVHHTAQPASNDSNLTSDAHSKQSAAHNMSFVYSDEDKLSHKELTEAERQIEEAFFRALKVLDLWKKIDKSNDRMVSAEELAAIVPSK